MAPRPGSLFPGSSRVVGPPRPGSPRPGSPRAVAACLVVLLASGCAGSPVARPVVGSPTPTVTPTAATAGQPDGPADRWRLTGMDLPPDWPEVPLPMGSEVVSAYAIGSAPRRTWSGTFAKSSGSALQMAAPVVAAMRSAGFRPIAAYAGPAATNTGLFSFAADTFAVYVVLGEDNGRPNLVMTVRGAPDAPSDSASGTPSTTNTGAVPG